MHFSLNGRTVLLLDTMSITWTVIDPGATGIKVEWENNQELAEYFRTISTGDCSYWLREFLKHWENMLLPEHHRYLSGVWGRWQLSSKVWCLHVWM